MKASAKYLEKVGKFLAISTMVFGLIICVEPERFYVVNPFFEGLQNGGIYSLDKVVLPLGYGSAELMEAENENVEPIHFDQLVLFERLVNKKTLLVYENGRTVKSKIRFEAIIQQIKAEKRGKYFGALPAKYGNNRYDQVVNYLFIKDFIYIQNCTDRFRARLEVKGNANGIGGLLRKCGSNDFSRKVYDKLKKEVQKVDPNFDYTPRLIASNRECNCYN